jgi:hypothetical protein
VGSQHAKAVLRYDPATGALLGTLPLTGFVTGASHLVFLNVPEPNGIGLVCAACLFVVGRRFRHESVTQFVGDISDASA